MVVVVGKEAAEKEINSWLDYKKVKASKRESFKPQIDQIIESMQAGDIMLNSTTFELTQKLMFPIEGLDISELTYKPRLTVADLRKGSATIKSMDFEGKMVSNIATATGKGASMIEKLDTGDFETANAIAIFF